MENAILKEVKKGVFHYLYKGKLIDVICGGSEFKFVVLKENDDECYALSLCQTLKAAQNDFEYFTCGFGKSNDDDEFMEDEFNDPKEVKIIEFKVENL